MKLLLDTHAFLWFVGDDSRLSEPAKTVMESPEQVDPSAGQTTFRTCIFHPWCLPGDLFPMCRIYTLNAFKFHFSKDLSF